jgi:hypothetical protein
MQVSARVCASIALYEEVEAEVPDEAIPAQIRAAILEEAPEVFAERLALVDADNPGATFDIEYVEPDLRFSRHKEEEHNGNHLPS